MYALKRLALRSNKVNRRQATPALYGIFNKNIYKKGRITESRLMMKYYLHNNPFRALYVFPIAWNLLLHGRLSIYTPKLTNESVKQVQMMLDKASGMRCGDE
jgi:hypothetical protein